VKNTPSWLSAATADRAMVWLVIGGVLLVVILLVRAVGHLSRGAAAAAAPAPAAKKSGGGGKLLLLAGLGGAGFWYWDTHLRHAPAGAAKAAPAPSPSPVPTPRPTVTQTVAPHITLPAHFPLTGTQILIGVAVIAVVAFLITRVVVRNVS
jgi:hypothetical protein